MYSKAGQTIRQTLVRPKDPLDPPEQCGVIYQTDCDVCGEVYVGETGRSLGERTLEHVKSIEKQDMKSALSQHQEQTGHRVNNINPLEDKIKVIAKEPRDTHRKIVEAIQIHLKKATLNRTDGFKLPDVYFPILREETSRGGH